VSAPVAKPGIWGLMAEFDKPADLVRACRLARESGYRRMDAYTPFPIEAVSEALNLHRNAMPLIVLCGGILGGIGGLSLEYWVSAVAYPLNIGGKPFFSLPAFIPVTFECTILVAAIFAVFGMLALNGLPMPHHPVFNVPSFALASRDRFFLCIEATDPKFDREGTQEFLEQFAPRSISEVES
jgi:Alternative complex III, ActD subunit